MVYQNELDNKISDIACYFTSIAYFRNLKDAYPWSVKELNDIFATDKLARFIDENDCIANPDAVASSLRCRMGFKGKYYPETYKPVDGDYIIGCWKKYRDAVEAHFVVMDCSGIYTKEHCIFDPWRGGSKTVREGLCTSLRVFRERL